MGQAPRFTLSFGFTCGQCKNNNPLNFYVMPVEGVKQNNTFGFLEGKYRIVCQMCKEEYIAELIVRRFADVCK